MAKETPQKNNASAITAVLLICAPYVLYGVKCIDLVPLAHHHHHHQRSDMQQHHQRSDMQRRCAPLIIIEQCLVVIEQRCDMQASLHVVICIVSFTMQLAEEELRSSILLIFANKQDLPNAMTPSEISEKLGLNDIKGQ